MNFGVEANHGAQAPYFGTFSALTQRFGGRLLAATVGARAFCGCGQVLKTARQPG